MGLVLKPVHEFCCTVPTQQLATKSRGWVRCQVCVCWRAAAQPCRALSCCQHLPAPEEPAGTGVPWGAGTSPWEGLALLKCHSAGKVLPWGCSASSDRGVCVRAPRNVCVSLHSWLPVMQDTLPGCRQGALEKPILAKTCQHQGGKKCSFFHSERGETVTQRLMPIFLPHLPEKGT